MFLVALKGDAAPIKQCRSDGSCVSDDSGIGIGISMATLAIKAVESSVEKD
ncbi:hypothetical protein MY1884_001555 [Beauveria asiatica]